MNKSAVNDLIHYAYHALSDVQIANNGIINKAFRGQISSFGAAVMLGSLTSAIAFFSDNGGASVERKKILAAILLILERDKQENKCESLYDYVVKNGDSCKEDIINAAIAIKLSMNLYKLV